MSQKITQLYAYIATDPETGDERIPAIEDGNRVVPLVGSDREEMIALARAVYQMSKQTGKEIRFCKFTFANDLALNPRLYE